ncbi:MAG: C40 family peptidase [Treponema sp.]|nr:C40 family peptidase [Treponema sp.]
MYKSKLVPARMFVIALVFFLTGISYATAEAVQDDPFAPLPSEPQVAMLELAEKSGLTLRQSIIEAGEHYLGAKYVYGKQSPATMEFDCAGFLSSAFQEGVSIKLPRSSKDIALVGTEVSPDQLRMGDIVYFDTDDRDGKKAVTHVAIYVEPNKLLHAISWPPSEAGVQFTAFQEDRYWYPRVLGYRRVINE